MRPTTNITVSTYAEGRGAAYDYFADAEKVSINPIGYDLIYTPIVRREIRLYECYTDSGSSDYFYFEIVDEQDLKP
jgi:hypothetical protein